MLELIIWPFGVQKFIWSFSPDGPKFIMQDDLTDSLALVSVLIFKSQPLYYSS